MKHFRLLRSGIDIEPFIGELNSLSFKWSKERGQMLKHHGDTENLKVREQVPIQGSTNFNNLLTRKTALYEHLPLLTNFLENFAQSIRGNLGKVMIVKLKENGMVYPHYDKGLYYSLHDRYHLVLISEGGRMVSGSETQIFRRGELWWFDNKAQHVALNEHDSTRTHVIFDVLPDFFYGRLTNLFKRHKADIFGYARITKLRDKIPSLI